MSDAAHDLRSPRRRELRSDVGLIRQDLHLGAQLRYGSGSAAERSQRAGTRDLRKHGRRQPCRRPMQRPGPVTRSHRCWPASASWSAKPSDSHGAVLAGVLDATDLNGGRTAVWRSVEARRPAEDDGLRRYLKDGWWSERGGGEQSSGQPVSLWRWRLGAGEWDTRGEQHLCHYVPVSRTCVTRAGRQTPTSSRRRQTYRAGSRGCTTPSRTASRSPRGTPRRCERGSSSSWFRPSSTPSGRASRPLCETAKRRSSTRQAADVARRTRIRSLRRREDTE